jgi:hypothetical protein|tara:strand:+ start:1623 stop:1820 length:198 start_codon:yes stop_codon:yes gene_type:complete
MAKTVFDVLVQKFDDDISSATQFLVGGSAKDFAGYKEIVGLIRGLEASKQYIEDLSRNYMDEEDD